MPGSAVSPVTIELEGVGHILRDRRLDVPPYQRGYAWEREQVTDFWWDLRAAFGASENQYFLGTVVLTSQSFGTSTIIDGQQRLATTLMMFTALRNAFLRRGDTERGNVIERQYIVTPDLRSGKSVPRLSLTANDQPWLEHAIARRPAPNDGAAANDVGEPLISALRFFEDRIEEEVKNAGRHWDEILFQWVEFLEHRARVIAVDVSDEADAFLIFETLNARGRALTVADLLKNYLFGLARTELDALQELWLEALDSLEASADEEIFTTFVRHLWSSMRGATRERDLYARMKAAINTKDQALAFGQELRNAAPRYAALLSADHPLWREQDELLPLAETLLRFGLEQNRPLLLSAMSRFPSDELARLLRALISWSVRGLIVGGIGGGSTERAYAEAAIAVSERRVTDTAGVFEELGEGIPSDEAFRSVFSTKTVNRTRLAKYLLIALARREAEEDDAYVVPDVDEVAHQLRYILPRNADPDEWTQFPPENVSQGVLRLGNQYVEDSEGDALPAEGILDDADWSPDAISDRQDHLAALAVEVWPRQP